MATQVPPRTPYPPPPPPPPPPAPLPPPQVAWAPPVQPPFVAQQAKPSAYWPLTIISLLFSWIVGGIALYFSAQVGKRWNDGNIEGARKASKIAFILGIAGIVVGLLFAMSLAGSGGATY